METKLLELRSSIIEHLGLDEEHVLFEIAEEAGITILAVKTFNPKHDHTFLFHSVKGVDETDAYQKMLSYVEARYDNENSYTLQWMKVGDTELHTSYFRGKSIYDVLDKFYYQRERNTHKIFSITLNPLT